MVHALFRLFLTAFLAIWIPLATDTSALLTFMWALITPYFFVMVYLLLEFMDKSIMGGRRYFILWLKHPASLFLFVAALVLGMYTLGGSDLPEDVKGGWRNGVALGFFLLALFSMELRLLDPLEEALDKWYAKRAERFKHEEI